MTPDTDPFLTAILAEPDDDLPRMLYADWLDEHVGNKAPCAACGGHGWFGGVEMETLTPYSRDCHACCGTGYVSNGFAERAEFIRTQVELARLPGAPCVACAENDCACKCAECLLRRRATELDRLDGNRYRETIAPLKLIHKRDGKEAYIFSIAFRRGFIAEITCTAAGWIAHADAILGACPIRGAKDGVVRLTTWPEIRRTANGLFGVVGRHRHYREEELPGYVPDGMLTPNNVLAAEWPGVRFELPPVGIFTGPPVPWDAPTHTTPLADVRRVMGAMERMAQLTAEGD